MQRNRMLTYLILSLVNFEKSLLNIKKQDLRFFKTFYLELEIVVILRLYISYLC